MVGNLTLALCSFLLTCFGIIFGMDAPAAPRVYGMIVATSSVCDFCLAHIRFGNGDKSWWKKCVGHENGKNRLTACTPCSNDESISMCAICVASFAELNMQ